LKLFYFCTGTEQKFDKELQHFLRKKLRRSSQKYGFGIPDPGSWDQKAPYPQHRWQFNLVMLAFCAVYEKKILKS
jgi:hypothetical protein